MLPYKFLIVRLGGYLHYSGFKNSASANTEIIPGPVLGGARQHPVRTLPPLELPPSPHALVPYCWISSSFVRQSNTYRTLDVVFSIPLSVRGSRQRTIPDVQQWYTGVGYFSDPKGKPGYFHYLVEVYRYIAGAAMLRMKEPSVEAIEASANPANGTPEDGVVVRYKFERE